MVDASAAHGPLDMEVVSGLRSAAADAGVALQVAERLINWLTEASLGRTDFDDHREAERYFDAVRLALSADRGATQ
jgi:hypothetical protein